MPDEIEIELPTEDGGWAEIDAGGLRPIRPRRAPARRPPKVVVAALAGVGGVLAAAGLIGGGGGGSGANRATSSSSQAVVSEVSAPTTADADTTTGPATSGVTSPSEPPNRFFPTPANDGRRVTVDGLAPAVPTGLRLVGLGTRGGLYDIDVDAGTITVHDLSPQTQSGAPTWLAAGADWVVIRPYDNVEHFLLRDGAPARPLEGELAGGTTVLLRGPGDTVWTESHDDSARTRLVLVGLDGTAVGPDITIDDLQVVGTDAAGALLVRGTGGTYTVGTGPEPAVPTRVTTGEVLAAGPGHLLVVECDGRLRCTRWLVDIHDGDRVDLGPDRARGYGPFVGSISPDGRHALVLRTDGLRRWEVIGTTAPGVEPVPVPLLALDPEQAAAIAWSADSRYLVYLGARRLWLFDTTTASDRPLVPVEAGFPDLVTIAARRAG